MQPPDRPITVHTIEASARPVWGAPSYLVPLGLGLLILVAPVVLLYRATVAQTDGTFCYPLDDTFIHMAIARNVASHGVYGVTPDTFSAASSSILWPLLLAAIDRVLGDRLLTPLVANLLLGAGVVVAVAREAAVEAPRSSVLRPTLVVAAVAALTPLPTIALVGMEHTAHVLVSLLFMFDAAAWLEGPAHRAPRRVVALAALAASLRYEALFMTGVVAALAFLRRRRASAVAILGASAVPVVLFGLYSIAHGGTFFPTSLLIKANRLGIEKPLDIARLLGLGLVDRVAAAPHMLAALAAAAVTLVAALQREAFFSRRVLRAAIALLVGLAHVQFANLGWFFRYEAYAVAMLVASVALYVQGAVPSTVPAHAATRRIARAAFGAAVILGVAPLAMRASDALSESSSAGRGIYEQQVQTARFLARFFPRDVVAINDIGAVAYFRSGPIVDLGGLATLDVARAKRFRMLRPMPTADVERLTTSAPIAIVYDEWVPNRPRSWTRLGQWRIAKCVSCGFPTVSIYATRPEHVPRLMAALVEFTPSLPEGVAPSGLYATPASTVPETSPEYVLAEGDTLLVRVPGLDPESVVGELRPDGRVALSQSVAPMLRGVRVGDLPAVVDGALATAANPGLPNGLGHAEARLVEPRANRYWIGGNVAAAGEVWSREPLTLDALVARAGGRVARSTTGDSSYVFRRAGNSYERVAVASDDPLRSLDVVVLSQ